MRRPVPRLPIHVAALTIALAFAALPSQPALATARPSTSTAASDAPEVTTSGSARWGMMGGFANIDMADLYKRGVRVVSLELSWRSAEPADNGFSSSYFQRKREELARYRAAGFGVTLNFGLHHAPDWLLAKPNARFVNQSGTVYTDSDEPNLVFATNLRTYGERYTARVFKELGTDFRAVRVGGGHWGELTYPQIFKSDGKLQNNYWAFDAAAARSNPVPSWKPCAASPNGEAGKFLTWYLDRLTAYQNWQIATVRRSYSGYVAVLYASWGMRSGDFTKATATNLCGTSSPEINGEVQRGFDHARHIRAITDTKAAVWGTWAEKSGTISWLASLADAKGLAKMGENSGSDDVTKMATAMNAAVTYQLDLLMWVRAAETYCRCNGFATIEDYARNISSR